MSRGVWGILGRIPTRKLIHKAPTVQILVVELEIKIVYHPLAVRLGALRRESDFELAVGATLKQRVNLNPA